MPILPVLDVLQGQVVRGVAGRRENYCPIKSQLTESTDVHVIAQAIRDRFAFTEFYLADLDAILGRPANEAVYESLTAAGFRLWIDAGLHTAADPLLERLKSDIVVGLESVEGPRELRRIIERAGVSRVVFSLDLKNGQPLGHVDRWPAADPWSIASHAIDVVGVSRLIVLDLANVGVGAGVNTASLCAHLKQTHPHVQLTTGGGVRGSDDVRRLTDVGVDWVLVASALHDGRIAPDDVR